MIQPTFPLQVLQFYFLHLICLEFILISGVSCLSPVTYYPRITFCIIPLCNASLKLHLHCTLCRLGLLCLFSLYWTILIIAGSSYSLIFIRYIVLQPGLLHDWHISLFSACLFWMFPSLFLHVDSFKNSQPAHIGNASVKGVGIMEKQWEGNFCFGDLPLNVL